MTGNSGEKNGRAKLSPKTAEKIRELLSLPADLRPSQRQVAQRLGVSQSTVSDVWTRKKWKPIGGGDAGQA